METACGQVAVRESPELCPHRARLHTDDGVRIEWSLRAVVLALNLAEASRPLR